MNLPKNQFELADLFSKQEGPDPDSRSRSRLQAGISQLNRILLDFVFLPTWIISLTLSMILFESLSACAFQSAQENFRYWMQSQVGKRVDEADAFTNRYPQLRISARNLPNGNVEEEYKAGYMLRCKVYFEIDASSQKIVSWRYEGTDQDCARSN